MKPIRDFVLTRPLFLKIRTQIRRHVNLFRLASQTGIPHAVLCAIANGWEPEFHRGRPRGNACEQWRRAFLNSTESDSEFSQTSRANYAKTHQSVTLPTEAKNARTNAASLTRSTPHLNALPAVSQTESPADALPAPLAGVPTVFSASPTHSVPKLESSTFERCPTCGGLVQLPCRKCLLERLPKTSRKKPRNARNPQTTNGLQPNLPPDCYARYLKVRERKMQEELERRAHETATEWEERNAR